MARYIIEDDACKFLEPHDEFTSVTDLYFRRGQVNLEYLERRRMLSDLADVAAEKLLFLDIETAGLHGMGLFLIGLLLFEDGHFKVKQLFAATTRRKPQSSTTFVSSTRARKRS